MIFLATFAMMMGFLNHDLFGNIAMTNFCQPLLNMAHSLPSKKHLLASMHKRGHTNQFMKFHCVPVPCPCRHSNKGLAEKMHWRHMQPCVQWALAQTDLLRTYLGNSFFVTQETKSFHPSFHPYDNIHPSMITFVLKTKTPRPRIHSRESWDPGFAYLQTLFMQRWRYIYNIFSPSHINFNTIHFSNENFTSQRRRIAFAECHRSSGPPQVFRFRFNSSWTVYP